ncbi:MAG: hypothetical protein ACRDGJ_05135 [Candidatus Limnocylindria bacterium]
MARRRSAPALDPLADPELAWRALDITRQAEAMGLLQDAAAASSQDRFRVAMRSLAGHGIGADALALVEGGTVAPATLDRVREALEDSPIPDLELRQLQRLFGWDDLAGMLHASVGSLRRYAASQRETPDEVAARAHWLAGVVGDLRGAYNDAGVRRWFSRPRSALGDRRPVDILTPAWSPDDADVRKVRELAGWLSGPGAAT